MDFYFLKLSWKNIWRNKRRTLLTVNAIGFGVMALVALRNYYDGFHEQVIHNVIRYRSGHMVVSAPKYHVQNSPQLYLGDTSKVDKWLKKNDKIKAFSHRVVLQGLISTPHGSANVGILGIEPENERRITKFSSNMVQGTYLGKVDPKRKPIVIGTALAKLLKVELGSKVVVLTQGVDGSIGNELFYVSGLFKTQSDFDKSMAFIPVNEARQLLSLPKKAFHEMAIVLKSDHDLGVVSARFAQRFPAGSGFKLESWRELQRPILAMVELNQSANRLLMFIILFVSALGVANAVLMSILERTREFGVMLAIGTSKREVMRFVVLETLFLSLVGIVLGNVLGIAVTTYFGVHGFDLAWFTSQKLIVQGAIIQTISYPEIHWINSFSVSMTVFLFSIIVSIIPVRCISQLQPVKALRAL